jgi:hypothetical protein
MLNSLHPDRMTAPERLDEIAEILAAGLMRLRARKSSSLSRDHGESSLDFSPDQRGHARPREREGLTCGAHPRRGLALRPAGAAVGVVDYRHRAGDAGRDERTRRDAYEAKAKFGEKLDEGKSVGACLKSAAATGWRGASPGVTEGTPQSLVARYMFVVACLLISPSGIPLPSLPRPRMRKWRSRSSRDREWPCPVSCRLSLRPTRFPRADRDRPACQSRS